MQRCFNALCSHKKYGSAPKNPRNKIERSEEFKNIISAADCKKLVALIRLILNHEKEQQNAGKHLHLSDERFLKEAEKMVTEEFSLVLGIDRDEVLKMVVSA